MRYRRLGSSDYNVSEIGLGCEHIDGKPYGEVKAVVDAAIDGGVNIFDVFMAGPEIRDNIGRALEGRRDRVMLQGHIGTTWRNGQYERSRDLERSKLFIKDFMDRTRSKVLDIAMVHLCDSDSDMNLCIDNGLFDYAHELKAKGLARLVGVSSHDAATAAKIVSAGLVDVLMFSTNLAFDLMPASTRFNNMLESRESMNGAAFAVQPERTRLYSLCEEKGVGITVMKTLGCGRLLNAASSPFGHALSVAQCIDYSLSRPAVASVLVGATSPEYVAEMLAYETASAEERDYSPIMTGSGAFNVAGKCMYCNHCLPCPKHISVADVTKYLDMQRETGETLPNTVSKHYDELTAHGGDCIKCGACEKRCPFGVSIRENMAEAARIFGK